MFAQLINKFHTNLKPKFHYRIHKSATDPPSTREIYFFRIHFNNTSASTPRSPQWSLPFAVPIKIFTHTHIRRTCYTLGTSHPPSFDRPNNIWWMIWIMKILIKQSWHKKYVVYDIKYVPHFDYSTHLHIGVIQQQIASICLTKAGLLIHDLNQKVEQSTLELSWQT